MASTLIRSFHARFLCVGIFEITCLCCKTRTLGKLKTAIRENIQEICEETLVKVETNSRKQVQICAHENGHYL